MFVFKSLPMTGFEPRTSGVGSDRSTNWDTSTAQPEYLLAQSLLLPNKYSALKYQYLLVVASTLIHDIRFDSQRQKLFFSVTGKFNSFFLLF